PDVRITAPKTRSTTNEEVVVKVDAVDTGGGVSGLVVYDNGARIAVAPEETREGNVVHYSFKLKLASGANQIRIKAASADGSWDSMAAELNLTCSRRADHKPRLYVIAAGMGNET